MHVSGKRGDCRSELKSPVLITFLYAARNGDRISKKCVRDAALGRLYTTAMRMIWLLCRSSVMMYSVIENGVRCGQCGDLSLCTYIKADSTTYFAFAITMYEVIARYLQVSG